MYIRGVHSVAPEALVSTQQQIHTHTHVRTHRSALFATKSLFYAPSVASTWVLRVGSMWIVDSG